MKTKVGKNGTNTNILYIPNAVMEYLDIKKGDRVEWCFDHNSKEPQMIIRKAK